MKATNFTPSPLVKLYSEIAPGVLDQAFPLNKSRCINATRICIDVFKSFGVKAIPFSVDVLIANKAYIAQSMMLGRYPTEQDGLAYGAWAVGINTEPDVTDIARNAWAGHLVAIVQDNCLVDSASGQFSRPHKNLPVPEVLVAPVEKKFFKKGKGRTYLQSLNGDVAIFMPRVEDDSFKFATGWTHRESNVGATREIIETMRARMKAAG